MTVQTRIFDEITALLGTIPEDEPVQRRRIANCRALASLRLQELHGRNARSLLHMAIECATDIYLAPHDVETLETTARFCRDLIVLAQKAFDLEGGV